VGVMVVMVLVESSGGYGGHGVGREYYR